MDIKCNCGINFCFNCLRESHLPSDCYLVEEWEKKMKVEKRNCDNPLAKDLLGAVTLYCHLRGFDACQEGDSRSH